MTVVTAPTNIATAVSRFLNSCSHSAFQDYEDNRFVFNNNDTCCNSQLCAVLVTSAAMERVCQSSNDAMEKLIARMPLMKTSVVQQNLSPKIQSCILHVPHGQ